MEKKKNKTKKIDKSFVPFFVVLGSGLLLLGLVLLSGGL